MASTVAERVRYESEPIKGSRFIATVVPVTDETTALAEVARVENEMPEASHHCWAYRLGLPALERSSDDGEPGGSAGRPILAQIAGHDIIDVVVIVTRYFGGTKLGVGGLVRAYGGCAGQALDRCETQPFIPTTALIVEHEYADGPAVDAVVRDFGLETLDAHYGAFVRRELAVPIESREAIERALREGTAGRVGLGEPTS